MKRQNEWDKLQEENEDLKSNIIKLRNENESLTRRFKHLIESEFIRSFDMVDGNGSWCRPIYEADRIAYGSGMPPSYGGVFELQAKTSEVINNNDSVICNPKAIIIKSDRLLAKEIKDDIGRQFDGTGIKCIFICGASGVDYIC